MSDHAYFTLCRINTPYDKGVDPHSKGDYVRYMPPADAKEANESNELLHSRHDFDKPKNVRDSWGYHHVEYPIISYHSSEWQWVRWHDPNWEQREINLVDSGSVTPVSWDLEPIEGHYANISQDGKNVTFFTDKTKGMTNARTSTRVGRYLTRFYPHLDADKVREMVCSIDKMSEIFFASTEEDIINVYVNGPHSCMAYDMEAEDCPFRSSVHPVSVYAGGDLQVAYLKGAKGKVSARALVWPEKKLYGRIYGDNHRMEKAFEALGYESDDGDGFPGARIRRIAHKNGERFVMPYIDNCGAVYAKKGDDEFFYLHEGDKFICDPDSQSGLSDEVYFEICSYYDEDIEDPYYSIHVEGLGICSSRVLEDDETGIYYCEASGNHYQESENPRVEMGDGSIWSTTAVEQHGVKCAMTGLLVSKHEVITLFETGQVVSRNWAFSNCRRDDEHWPPRYYLTNKEAA